MEASLKKSVLAEVGSELLIVYSLFKGPLTQHLKISVVWPSFFPTFPTHPTHSHNAGDKELSNNNKLTPWQQKGYK